MKLRVPFYYKDFHCITTECKDNCCVGGWEIDIDEDTYDKYLKLEGELGEELRKAITKTDEYCFKLKDGHCPFLQEDGLCRVHSNLGEEYLGNVCSQFPRFSEYYGEIKETGIGLACEEAERIIFSYKEPFKTEEMPCSEKYVEDEEYDRRIAKLIFKAREVIFKVLNMESHSNHEKLVIILKLCESIQEYINEDNYEAILEYINSFENDTIERILDEVNSKFENGDYDDISLAESVRNIFYVYEDMEVLNDDWEKMLSECIKNFHEDIDDEEYSVNNEEFLTNISDRNYEYKNLFEYLIYRYFCKSIYDHDVLGKARMLVSNFLVIKELDMYRWLKNKKIFTFEDRMDIIHMFSRQVEYSEENMDILYEGFIFDSVFDIDNLCGLLWIDSAAL